MRIYKVTGSDGEGYHPNLADAREVAKSSAKEGRTNYIYRIQVHEPITKAIVLGMLNIEGFADEIVQVEIWKPVGEMLNPDHDFYEERPKYKIEREIPKPERSPDDGTNQDELSSGDRTGAQALAGGDRPE